jgi:hypothetical protein
MANGNAQTRKYIYLLSTSVSEVTERQRVALTFEDVDMQKAEKEMNTELKAQSIQECTKLTK